MPGSNPGAAGLESWFTLDEESGTRYDAHGGNDLAQSGGVGFDTGKKGNAADFESSGTDQYLSIADNASLSFVDEALTLGCWVNFESHAAAMGFVTKYNLTGNDAEYALRYNNSTDRFNLRLSSSGSGTTKDLMASTFGSPSNAVWYFVLAWHDPVADFAYIQINNGTVDSSAYSGGMRDGASDFIIGATHNGAGQNNHMDGLIDEAFVYRRVLTAAQRTWLYNDGNGRIYSELRSGIGVAMTPILRI